jgi:hypothetical protein
VGKKEDKAVRNFGLQLITHFVRAARLGLAEVGWLSVQFILVCKPMSSAVVRVKETGWM